MERMGDGLVTWLKVSLIDLLIELFTVSMVKNWKTKMNRDRTETARYK